MDLSWDLSIHVMVVQLGDLVGLMTVAVRKWMFMTLLPALGTLFVLVDCLFQPLYEGLRLVLL